MKLNHRPTKEVNYKAIVVAVDVSGRIRLKLNSDISHGGIELEMWSRATVLAQDVGSQVITIIEGQQVILPQMETRIDITKKRSYFLFVFPLVTLQIQTDFPGSEVYLLSDRFVA